MANTVTSLLKEIREAELIVQTYKKDRTPAGNYKRFMARMLIKKLKIKLKKLRVFQRYKTTIQRERKRQRKKVFIKDLHTKLTFQDLDFKSLGEVRRTKLIDVIERVIKKYKEYKLTYKTATGIVNLLNERENSIIGIDL